MHKVLALAVRLLLAVALVASGCGLLAEVHGALVLYDTRQSNTVPFFWRFGMAPVERFASCMAAARKLMPAGSVVAFASQDGPHDAAFYRWRWAAYLLPELHLVRAGEPSAAGEPPAAYLLAYRKRVDERRLALIAQLPGGRLYRVLP